MKNFGSKYCGESRQNKVLNDLSHYQSKSLYLSAKRFIIKLAHCPPEICCTKFTFLLIIKPGGLDVETNRDRDRERP